MTSMAPNDWVIFLSPIDLLLAAANFDASQVDFVHLQPICGRGLVSFFALDAIGFNILYDLLVSTLILSQSMASVTIESLQ